mmetsp:Transcript_13130/g.22186  ORF Transcript_13130/g.22186 Transcript_13130/m.22186 type:complete len:149 (-) Transcript_13130:187-633(-)
MQKNKEIGKIQKDVPMIISRVTHQFIRDLTIRAAAISKISGKTGSCQNFRLTKEHVRDAVEQTKKFKFLMKVVRDVPSCQPTSQKEKKEQESNIFREPVLEKAVKTIIEQHQIQGLQKQKSAIQGILLQKRHRSMAADRSKQLDGEKR